MKKMILSTAAPVSYTHLVCQCHLNVKKSNVEDRELVLRDQLFLLTDQY